MKKLSSDVYSSVFAVVHLGLVTNVLLVISALPVIVLLLVTDPAHSWLMIALALPLCAPGATAACTVFRAHAAGETRVARVFVRGWCATWRPAMAAAGVASCLIVILLVDVRALASSAAGVVVVPLLLVSLVVVAAITVVALGAIAEVPRARFIDVVRASSVLAVRRWYLTAASVVVLMLQFAVFTSAPAIALGITAAPALYLVWANTRYTLRPVLDTTAASAL